jgi:hypothetical protein
MMKLFLAFHELNVHFARLCGGVDVDIDKGIVWI